MFITGFEQFDDNVLWYCFCLVLVLRVVELLGSEGLLFSLNLGKKFVGWFFKYFFVLSSFFSSFQFLCIAVVVVQSLSRVQLFVTPVDYSRPGSSVQGISQARILEWAAISFSRGSS